jgi:hypothetical protein
MSSTLLVPLVDYRQLQGEIHRFTWYDASNNAIDQWMDCVSLLSQQAISSATLRILHISEIDAAPSVRYIMHKVQQLNKEQPGRCRMRSAVCLQQKNFIVNTIIATMSRKHDRTRLFDMNELEVALAWLLEND